jgi:hypothetical protein
VLNRILRRTLIKVVRAGLLKSSNKTDIILGHAVSLFLKETTPQHLENELSNYYKNADVNDIVREVQLDKIYSSLITSGYKTDVLNISGTAPHRFLNAFNLWQRRLYLLRFAQIRIDLIILKQNASIPAHAHRGVLSGFLVLKGQVNIRHYHVVSYHESGVVCRKSIDTNLTPGGYTTNHDEKDNIHLLTGIDFETVLYRFNITGLPSSVPAYETLAGRMYVDISQIDDKESFAPFITLPAKNHSALSTHSINPA